MHSFLIWDFLIFLSVTPKIFSDYFIELEQIDLLSYLQLINLFICRITQHSLYLKRYFVQVSKSLRYEIKYFILYWFFLSLRKPLQTLSYPNFWVIFHTAIKIMNKNPLSIYWFVTKSKQNFYYEVQFAIAYNFVCMRIYL